MAAVEIQAAAGQPGRRTLRRGAAIGATHLLLSAGAIVMTWPFLWMVLGSLQTVTESQHIPPVLIPSHPQFQNYSQVWSTLPMGSLFLNTTAMALGRAIPQLLLGSLAAYAFARIRFPFRGPLFILFLSVMMVPAELLLIPQYLLMQKLGWLNTIQALIVPGLVTPIGVFLLRQFFLTIPREIDDAARLDGASYLQIWWRIMLPLAKPALIAVAILSIVSSWQTLLWPLIVNTSPDNMTLAVGMASLQGEYVTNFPILMAGAVMAVWPLIIMFFVLQRRVIAGITLSGFGGK